MSEALEDMPPLTDKNKARQLLWGLLFGIVFGFLLQKGGVAKYHVLIGVLLLRDFTVIKVMLSAILVGMIGIFVLQRAGLVKLHLKPTRYLANSLGGIIFGIGFALSAYCPGTGAAALGQGNLDALAVIAGLIIGSYLFAEMSGWIGRKVNPIGERGELTWPQVLHLPTLLVTVVFAMIILFVLISLELSNR
ncbi:MAG: YeeE/YedE thiosulfate transporter family protein [Phycisphaerales bacterium]